MLLFQDKHYQTAGFILEEEGTWAKKFTIESRKYKLINAFGPFLVGLSFGDMTIKLLELGGKRDNTIVTEMSLC